MSRAAGGGGLADPAAVEVGLPTGRFGRLGDRALERLARRLPKYGRGFVRLADAWERGFRAFDRRRLRTFVGARAIPRLPYRVGGHSSFTDWCFQAGVYAGIVGGTLPPGARILDLGCGAGLLVPGLLQVMPPGALYVGADIDEGVIRQNRLAYRDSRLEFRTLRGRSAYYAGEGAAGDAMEEVLAAGPWDVIVAKALFDHLAPADGEAYLERLAAALAVGGRLLATYFVLDADYEAVRSELPARFRFDDPHPRHAGYRYCAALNAVPEAQLGIDGAALTALLERAGLRATRLIPGTWRDPKGARGADMPDTLVLEPLPRTRRGGVADAPDAPGSPAGADGAA